MTRLPHTPKIRLEITEEIIEHAIGKDSSHCVVAEAVRAAYPGAARIAVDLQTIRFSDQRARLRYTYLTPRAGQVCLVNFDQGVRPAPFSMMLRGGQVTTMKGTERERKPLSEAQLAQRIAASHSAARMIMPADGNRSSVPEKSGGKPPPLSSFARRREFGLRGLSR